MQEGPRPGARTRPIDSLQLSRDKTRASLVSACCRSGGKQQLWLWVHDASDMLALLASAHGRPSTLRTLDLHGQGMGTSMTTWSGLVGQAWSGIRELTLSDLNIEGCSFWASLASCKGLERLKLDSSATMQLGLSQQQLDGLLPQMLPAVRHIQFSTPGQLPLVHALAPQLTSITLASVARLNHHTPALVAALVRLQQARHIRAVSIPSQAVLDALLVLPSLQTVDLPFFSGHSAPISSEQLARCRWQQLSLGSIHLPGLACLPLEKLHSLTLHGISVQLSGEGQQELQAAKTAVQRLMRVPQLSPPVGDGEAWPSHLWINCPPGELPQHTPQLLQTLRPVVRRLQQVKVTLFQQQGVLPVAGSLVPWLAAALGPWLAEVELRDATVDGSFWPALLQALPSFPQLRHIELASPASIAQLGMGMFCMAVPSTQALTIKVTGHGLDAGVEVGVREVQAMLRSMQGFPRGVLVELGGL
uniref:Uncharacterized protein n=1 Tax=Chlamydomonas leiostraca TaxID=1034604 RepID=A0A7S0RGB2_9CHLO|mmetsp:Transcript_22180/g.56354  ORF Transcript_22180/g.56354 Transcript_22180/m.56354 type:complete len:475 (+) Transcript_22180:135-1559(+)